MLKVTVHEEDQVVMLHVEGRVVEPMLTELRRVWQGLTSSIGSRQLTVDLRGLTFIDEAGRKLLGEIHARTGAEFIADTPMTRYFAEEAMQIGQTNSR